jgi:putative ABC transport system permease protein
VLSLVATTTVMAVQDRIQEHAVLQTLGVRPLQVFGLVVTESLLLSTFGGVLVAVGVGIIAGIAPGWQASRTEIVSALRHA